MTSRSSSVSPRRRIVAALSVIALAVSACGSDEAGDSTADTTADTTGDTTVDTTGDTAAETVEERPGDTTADSVSPTTGAPTTTTTVVLGGGSGSGSPTTDEPAATAPPATDPPATEAPTTAAPTPSGPECLIGSWVITNAEMNAFYDAVVANSGVADFDIEIPGGQVGLIFTEDTYEYSAEFQIAIDVAGSGGTGTAAGVVSGTWSTTDGVITTTLGESSLSVQITVMGVTIDGSDIANGILNSVPINDAPYDCAGPTIDFQTGDGTPRHPVTLTPA